MPRLPEEIESQDFWAVRGIGRDMDRTKHRSDSYQYKLLEIPTDLTIWDDANEAPPPDAAEREVVLRELRLELLELLTACAKRELTERQWVVFEAVCLRGERQADLAKRLGINQSSVAKTLGGNCDYRTGVKRVYGGLYLKLRRVAAEDPAIVDCLSRIGELLT